MKTLFQFYLALLIAVAIGCSVPAAGPIADPRIMQQVAADARAASTLVSHRLEMVNEIQYPPQRQNELRVPRGRDT